MLVHACFFLLADCKPFLVLEVRKRDVEVIGVSVECALGPDLNLGVLD